MIEFRRRLGRRQKCARIDLQSTREHDQLDHVDPAFSALQPSDEGLVASETQSELGLR